jgi:O-methyltransferase
MFVFHEGWFQDTTKEWNGAIALLRIDGDLYDSVLVCLKNLYPYLVAGGICILDDYDLEGGRRAFDEYFQGSLVPTSTNPAWWVK